MTYRFQFDRARLRGLVAGLALLALLCYAAGVLTGIVLWTPAQTEIAMLKSAGREERAVVAAGAAPARTPVAAAPPTAAEPAAAPAPPPAPSPLAAMAATLPAPEPPVAAAAEDVFSVQLGSFLDAKNAQQLVGDLKQRGYSATIFSALDTEQREWHVVRIPGFKSLESASRAAATFTGKERMQALVRRSAAL